MNQQYTHLGLKNPLQREESYKKDCKFFESQLPKLPQALKLEQKKELSPVKSPLPVLRARTNIQEIVKTSQQNKEFETRIKEETEKPDQLESEPNILVPRYSRFPEQESSPFEQFKSNEHRRNLGRNFKFTIKSGKSSTARLKQEIAELENKIKSLDRSALRVKTSILKKNVQVKLLQHSLYSELSFPVLSPDFLYKPTLNNLNK